MARTKQRVLDDHRTAAQKHAAREAAGRRAAAFRKAARMLSTQELYELPSQKHSDIDSDSDEDGSLEKNSAVCAACMLGSNVPFIFVFTACAVCACMPPRVLFAGLLLAGVGGSCILRVCLRESPAFGSGSTSAGGGGGRLGRRGARNFPRARAPTW